MTAMFNVYCKGTNLSYWNVISSSIHPVCIEWNVRVFNIWLLRVGFFLPSLYFYFEIFLFQLWFINELWSSLSVFIEDFLWIFYYLMWILYIKICISVDFWQFSVGHPADSRSFLSLSQLGSQFHKLNIIFSQFLIHTFLTGIL